MTLASSMTACPGCDLLIAVPTVPTGYYLACGRCGTAITRTYRNSLARVLALSSAGLTLFIPAMMLPLMTLSFFGIKERGSVLDTSLTFYHNGYFFVALVVLLTAVIIPFLKLFLAFIVAANLKLGRRPTWLRSAFKLLARLVDWGMVDIYLLGIIVTIVKMKDMASISFDIGFFSFIALVLTSVATTACLDRRQFWLLIGEPVEEDHARLRQALTRLRRSSGTAGTAAEAKLLNCRVCGYLVADRQNLAAGVPSCPRCHSPVHWRISGSITKTWVLILTSIILLLPANLLPIMRVDYLGLPDYSTIVDGILYFFKEGAYGIGMIILTASVLVPLFKIIGLMIILLTIRTGNRQFLKQKAAMFRFIEFIGRWSMLDIFVVALLCVLVDFGFLSSVHTAPGATFFCGVVVATMSAALVFDPRILWDSCDPPGETC